MNGLELSNQARFPMQKRNIQPSWLTETLGGHSSFAALTLNPSPKTGEEF